MRKAPFARTDLARPSRARWLPGVSRGAMAALLLAVPVAARAQFAGSAAVVHGSATISTVGSTQTVNIGAGSPVTTINWTPTDSAIGGGPINFLPQGQTVAYVGSPLASVPYTVLNRILPADPTRSVAFNGAITSTANTRVWFYSPGGLLIGSTATFNVGGLVLTAADPVTDGTGNYITTASGTDSFSVAAAAGSTSAITIQSGASINAVNSGQASYIVAIAPQIIQGGTISVAGSAALVAAESATFSVDSKGLFNIGITAGSTVSSNTFVHTGITGGPDTAAQVCAGCEQRIYMVAVPKNNAITMAIASSGSIGFPIADAANLDGSTIVLSAGSNIADSGTGNPVVAGRAGSGTSTLTVGGGNYTSNTYAVSTDIATVTDPALGITFGSNLLVSGSGSAEVNPTIQTISVAGNLVISADGSALGGAGTASIGSNAGANLVVGANAAALGVNGDLTVTANDAFGGHGGTTLVNNSGSISVAGNATFSANGLWGTTGINPGGVTTTGGNASVNTATGGSLTIGGSLNVSATADATGAAAFYQSGGAALVVDATGGSASLSSSGVTSATGGLTVNAQAISGVDNNGNGGTATGGTALVQASGGGTVSVGVNGAISAIATAAQTSTPQSLSVSTSNGGNAIGGSASIIANGGAIKIAGTNGFTALATATGGASLAQNGDGGNASGGAALVETLGTNATIANNTAGLTTTGGNPMTIDASATGGAQGSTGGTGTGGNALGTGYAQLLVNGSGQSITLDRIGIISVNATGTGGSSMEGNGGGATGGYVGVSVNGGTLTITNTSLLASASAQGGNSVGAIAGNAVGGTANIVTGGSGVLMIEDLNPDASAIGGSDPSGIGGNAVGGNIFLTSSGGTLNFDTNSATYFAYFNASSTGGTGATVNGTATSAGGVLLTNSGTGTITEGPISTSGAGDIDINGKIELGSNTPLYVEARGSINIAGSIDYFATGVASGASLHLWSDDSGTGTGTVTLASGAINLPGSQTDIYYNPVAIGSPTSYAGGFVAGNVTAYQLLDNINQLQSVNNYLSQNFALGAEIDASATVGWNSGAGFVPIGSGATPFTGNFDGLNNTVTNLYINRPGLSNTGLFGQVGAGTGATITIRNTRLVNPDILGATEVGGLIGTIGADNVMVANSFTTGGVITGNYAVGGLVGLISPAGTITLNGVHSDAAINGSGNYIAGLVGLDDGATIINAFATGTVAGLANSAVGIGGLIGAVNGGSVSQSYATGAVSAASGSYNVGGLIGVVFNGTVNKTYAVGAVTVDSGASIGGLVGYNLGTISESWASGLVSGSGSVMLGGLVGYNDGTVSNSYWDSYSTGLAAGYGTNAATVTNLNPVTSDPSQAGTGNYAFGPAAYGNFTSGAWIYDDNVTRPIGAWEVPTALFDVARIDSAHQVQLIDAAGVNNSLFEYRLIQTIDMSGTSNNADVWGAPGFQPLGGENATPFTAGFEGQGFILKNLTINSGFNNVGLIQIDNGYTYDVGLTNVSITASNAQNVGAFAGQTGNGYGSIFNSFATGSITLTQMASENAVAGGLVGFNQAAGSINQTYATVSVTGGGAIVGGLVGTNAGTISQSYANGNVAGTGTNFGGLVGSNGTATLANSYWDSQLSGQSLACGGGAVCNGAAGLTTAQTLQAASFPGLSIDTVGGQGLPWRLYPGVSTPLLSLFITPSIAGFEGFASVVLGSATITDAGATQTVNVGVASPVTTINWGPYDGAIGGGAINFLPAGQTVDFVGTPSGSAQYTVLNRILPNDPTRSVAFNGAITSTPNTRVWFYSPGGLLIGSTGTFNVGSLVLTAGDPVTDANGNFVFTNGGVDAFAVSAASGSTSAITIQPGALITAVNPGQSSYVVAIAPQID